MKKLCKMGMAMLLFLCLTACATLPKQQCDNKKQTHPRVVKLFAPEAADNVNYQGNYDFDADGQPEEIELAISSVTDPWYDETIAGVYAFDMDTSDGLLDLGVVTVEYSADPALRIFRYNADLTQHSFASYNHDENGYTEPFDRFGLGYAINYYFAFDDAGVLTVESQTESSGMWSIYKTYKADANGVWTEVLKEKYEILPDFFTMHAKGWHPEEPAEAEMWHKGYVKAYIDYSNSEMTLKAGEYFKPLYDDRKNNIYIEKENGEGGWMNIDYTSFNREALNTYFFSVAG